VFVFASPRTVLDTMARFFTPSEDPLRAPGTRRRLIRRPDVRQLFTPQLSGVPLSSNEVDYDDLIIHRAYRSYDPHNPGEVRYFMYELSQRNPGDSDYGHFWKAVRMVRLTRVPRYLRQGTGSGPGMMFEQQRDLLAALREQQVLFLNLIAKSPQLPLIFAYGVQGVADTPEDAQRAADDAYAVLTYQLDGTYQQLEYAPITFEDGERLARYQAEWEHLAMGRGRPLPAYSNGSSSSLLDGNRTDVEGINNQLESFIRGMGDRSFLLSLVTVPLSPAEITLAWRNITEKLSDVRSDQDGARSVTAGVALPLTMGNSLGDSHGNTHSSGSSAGVASSDGTSHSVANGVSDSYTSTSSQSASTSQSAGVSHSTTDSVNQTVSHGQSLSHTDSLSQGVGTSHSDGSSISAGVSQNQGVGVSQTDGVSTGQALNQSASVSDGQSLGQTASVGQNWNNSIGQGVTGSQTHTTGSNQSQADGVSQSINLGNTRGDSLADAWNQAFGNNFNGGLLGIGGGANSTQGQSGTSGANNSNSLGMGLTGSGTHTIGVSDSLANALSKSVNVGESFGGSTGLSSSATHSVGTSQSVGLTQSVGASHSQGVTQTAGVGQSLSQGLSTTDGVNQNLTQGQSLAQGESLSNSAGVGRSDAVGQSQTLTQGQSVGQSQAVGRSTSLTGTDGTNSGVSQNQALSDAYMVAMSRQASASSSLAVAPSFGVTLSKQTRDEAKRFVGDILEAQMRRYSDGIKSGAFLYQMFLLTPDRETLAGGSGLLKSAFWGAGGTESQLPQPFHTITEFPIDGEQDRLRTHAQAFTSYRRRERVTALIEPFAYSTYLTPGEAAAFTHPPTAEGLGLLSVHDSMPVMRMPHDRQDREIRLGYIVNGERAKVSDVFFGVDIEELTHTLITGVTGSGKALALDTPIPTPAGWTTMGALEVGDTILDDQGRPTAVTFATDVMTGHDCYRVEFSDGTSVLADGDHLWLAADWLDRAAAGQRRNRGPGFRALNQQDMALAHRLQALATNGGPPVSIPEIIMELGVQRDGFVRTAIKKARLVPVDVRTVPVTQQYGTKAVTKLSAPTAVYDRAKALQAVAEALLARVASRGGRAVERLVTTREMAASTTVTHGRTNWSIRATEPLDLPTAELPIDPYVLGVWLGDGNTGDARFTCADAEIVEAIRERGHTVTPNANNGDVTPVYQISNLYRSLRAHGLLGSKHVPARYLRGSSVQRLDLLRGLMDSHGTVSASGNCAYDTTNEQLAESVLELVRSFGIAARLRKGTATLHGVEIGPKYTVTFTTDILVVTLPRKAERLPKSLRTSTRQRYVTAVVPVGSVPVRCIEVASDSHLFLAGDSMVPTHNTTTLMRFLADAVRVERTLIAAPATPTGVPTKQVVRPSVLFFDWMRNGRNLASVVEADRFKFFSMLKPELGEFRWNLLAVPCDGMSPVEWLNAQCDNFTASFNLGEFGRSLLAEFLTELYTANRLEPYVLRPAVTDDATGVVLREAIELPAIDRAQLPADAIQIAPNQSEFANVFTYPELSRCVSMADLATLVAARVEDMAKPENARMYGTAMRDRLQSLWRRMQYFAPGGQFSAMLASDPDLDPANRECLTVWDLVDPDTGTVTVVETDGLDIPNRRVILGSILLAMYKTGLSLGDGTFDNDRQGPGTFVVLEEAHELFGEQGADEDQFSASTRTALYESMFRRARALGLRLVVLVQNPAAIPAAITSNTATVIVHQTYDENDRKRIFSLLNWQNQIGRHLREFAWLGEMPIGWALVRLQPKKHYLEAAPVQIVVDPPPLSQVTDAQLAVLATQQGY
jgi:hypothetical protein